MSKARRKKDRDDVLRAADIVPPYGRSDAEKPGRKKAKTARKSTSTSKKKAKRSTKSKAAKPTATEQDSAIPKLDLDRQILARQRKATSVKRKGPGAQGKTATGKAKATPPQGRGGGNVPEPPEADPVISQIVARDIQRLCRG